MGLQDGGVDEEIRPQDFLRYPRPIQEPSFGGLDPLEFPVVKVQELRPDGPGHFHISICFEGFLGVQPDRDGFGDDDFGGPGLLNLFDERLHEQRPRDGPLFPEIFLNGKIGLDENPAAGRDDFRSRADEREQLPHHAPHFVQIFSVFPFYDGD